MSLASFKEIVQSLPDTQQMPVLFVGHGSPMNGIEDSVYSDAWKKLGTTLPCPSAILVISAHWYTEGTHVHIAEHPKTIHDFYGFPQALYDMGYAAPGSPTLARGIQELVVSTEVQSDTEWGLDHGAWVVLSRMYPEHNIPTLELSIDGTKPMQFHYDLGRELAALRTKGVLILGSGNIVHNLGMMRGNPDAPAYPWAEEFDAVVASHIAEHNHAPLISYESLGEPARYSIPTPEHYIPLLYTLGVSTPSDTVSFPATGIAHGSISMRSVLFG